MEWITEHITYIWFGLGIFLLCMEILLPGFVIFWFGAGAIVTGILSFFIPSIPVQVGIFIITSILSLIIWFKMFPKRQTGEESTSDDYWGLTGTCSQEVSNINGKIVLDKPYHGVSEWSAITEFGTLPEGTRIVVTNVDGITLNVKEQQDLVKEDN